MGLALSLLNVRNAFRSRERLYAGQLESDMGRGEEFQTGRILWNSSAYMW